MAWLSKRTNEWYCPTYEEAEKIPICECGERLVALQDYDNSIISRPSSTSSHVLRFGELLLLRTGVVARLLSAATHLEKQVPGAKFAVRAAWRHPSVQEEYFDKKLLEICAIHPEFSREEAFVEANKFYASLDVAGHPTGGALDLTIEGDGVPLDMGTLIGDFSDPELVRSDCRSVSSEAQKNRSLLRSLMLNVGFAPYNGEWWHYSIGDREASAYYGLGSAKYGAIYEVESTDPANQLIL